MKKLFIKFSMMLFVLGMSTNTVWAGGNFDTSSLPPEMLQTLMSPTYCAQLTGHASSTGGGKVYVNAPQAGQSVSADPRDNDYVEDESNVAVSGMGMSMAGMTKIGINAWAKADPGYWFAGFSYSNMGVDLGITTDENMPGLYASTYDIGIQENETIKYVIYGTFEPIRIAGYEITGNTTTSDDGAGNMVCDLAIIFTPSGAEVNIDASDFKKPVVSGAGWSLTNWDYNNTNAGKVTVNVHFTTTSTDVAEYAGTLKLETQATPAISMNVTLNARTAASSEIEAIRYNKNKVKQGEGSLSAMIAAAAPTDVIKLNKNHNSEVIVNRSFTLDLNGYNLQVLANTAITVKDNATLTLAFSPYGGQIQGFQQQGILVESGSKAILKGGTIVNNNIGVKVEEGAELELDGAMVAGNTNAAIDNAGKVTTTDGVIVGLVKTSGEFIANGGSFRNINETVSGMQHAGGPAIQIEDGNVQIKKGTITGETYGVQTNGGSTTIEKLAVISGGTKALNGADGTLTVNNGKFTDPNDLSTGSITFNAGYFQSNNSGATEVFEKSVWRNTAGAEFRENYLFFAGDVNAAKAAGVSVCHIGGVSYSSLEDALAYANNTSEPVVIIMDNDYTLPAGYYTLPSTATLIIPKSNEQGASSPYVDRDNSQTTPSMFRKLTLESGVNLDVFGIIEVGGTQFTGSASHTGATTGEYGQLQLNEGSRITLQNGSIVRAWGYITGDIEHQNPITHVVPMGEIDARRGATIYEMFQMGDWGNTIENGVGLVTGDSRFPVNSYFVQNIEAPVKYHPGAKLFAQTSVSAGGMITMCANEIQVIGVSKQDVAVFLMDENADAENTWVRKWYDASNDQQVYEINSGAHIGSLVINLASSPLFDGMENYVGDILGMPKVTTIIQESGAHFEQDIVMNSGQYVLPITYNFKLHLLSGTLDFTQNTELIPGAELEIDKGARVYVTKQSDPDVLSGSLYIWDNQDWGKTPKKVDYSPVFGGEPTTRDINNIESAIINVHGTFDTNQGYIFTSERGGNIFSSVEDAGTFMFTENARAADYYEEVKVSTSSTANCYSAFLRNSDEYVAAMRVLHSISEEEAETTYRYVKTGGTVAGQSYCYIDMGNGGEWTRLEQRGCFTYNAADETYYIKPQEYVAVVVTAVWDEENGEFTSLSGNDDHTFSDAAGAGRLFINLGNPNDASSCQWWEVEKKDNYYHCIHPDNDTYYYWDETEWKEVKFTITWKNWDGSTITTYSVPYGTQAEWLSTNPTREKNVDYTYDFTGWSPALGKVTSDVTYTATYEAKQIKYTITFEQDGGVEIEKHLLARDEVPVCENTPTRTGYILQWEPGIEPVVGNQTYTATWLPAPPETYTITFKNYDGTVLKKEDGTTDAIYTVEADHDPAYDGETPTKTVNEGKEYTYEFTGWKPELAPATTNATYVAQFNEVARTYVINFYDENKETIIKTENLTYGATPTPPAVTKTNPAEGYTYTYVWKNTTDATKSIESVKGAADYKPVFTRTANKYTVTLQCNVPGACTFTGAGIHTYGDEVAISATIEDPTTYEFINWQEETTHSFGTQTITGDVLYTVMVKEKNKTPVNLPVGIDETDTIASASNYMNVTITSDGVDHSSQIVNANNITLYGNADFVFKHNIKAGYWYSFAVPWRVDATSGVYLGSSSTPAVLGKDFEIIYYDGSIRAAQGKVDACWVYMKNLSTKKVLEPGRAYMIFIKHGSQSQIVFRKKVQEPILTTTATVNQYNAVNDLDANWNAIANPALYKAYMYAGTDPLGFYYISENDEFDWYHLNEEKLVVGEAVYIQAPTTGTIVANSSKYAAAPRRAKAEQATSFDVQITAAGTTKRADHISVQIDENKEENKYVIGKDLTKFGVSAKLAQMWINRYDVKLCFNTIAPEGDNTSFPMSIYAPKAGEYTIAIEREVATEDYALYLTYNGEAIWNLSDGAYTANLNKGTDANYGLRISVRKAPEVATGMDEAVVDSKEAAAYKVLINNQVFIIRGEKVYSIDGQLVK